MKKVITAGLSFAMAASMLAGCSSKPAENLILSLVVMVKKYSQNWLRLLKRQIQM